MIVHDRKTSCFILSILSTLESFDSELTSSDTQCVGNAIDVVEPRSNERDLQNALIVETSRSQPLVIGG